jgi:hypothetical protein
MSKKMFLIAPFALLLASLAASAQEPELRRGDAFQDHESHRGDAYQDREFRGDAFRGPSLPVMVRELDRAARELSVQANYEIFPRGRRRVEALRSIRQFEIEARRFHALVENRRGRIGRSQLAAEFERLERSFDRTSWAFERHVRPSRELAADFRRVEISMSRLDDRL